MDNQQIFFNRIGSLCTHAEEAIGSDLFYKLTINKCSVNPTLTFSSNILYLNGDGKLKMYPNYIFHLSQLSNDEWADMFINDFMSIRSDCKTMIGVLTSSKNLNWYVEFISNLLGAQVIEKDGQRIIL